MKIAQIVNPVIPLPPTTIGGTERVVQYLLNDLVSDGHEVTFMGHNDSVVPPGVKFIPVGTYLSQQNTAKKIWKHLILNKYDVIHNHGRLIYFLPEIWSGTRKIHTFHMAELETKSFQRFVRLKPRNFTFAPCGKWIQERYRHVPDNWQYVNNGVPLNAYHYDNNLLPDDAPLLVISRIGPSKGVLDAIDIALNSNRKLIIAGKGGDYPHEKEWFHEVFEKWCDGKQVRFIGPVTDGQKQNLLNSAAALLIPTVDSEAFNTTMIEANACGCPVISYNRFCFTEFIKNGVNGFTGNTPDELTEAVGKLHTINRLNCRLEFEKNYTSRIMTDNYLKLYQSKV